jgi:DNA-binding IclR family transcriptional regulator
MTLPCTGIGKALAAHVADSWRRRAAGLIPREPRPRDRRKVRDYTPGRGHPGSDAVRT